MTAELLDIFAAHEGIVCLVGAGGKKTTLYRLAADHPGRVALTSTVFTPPFRKRLKAHQIVAEEEQLVSEVITSAESHERIAYAHPSDKAARLSGVDPLLVQALHGWAGFDVTFVKADGARLRWLKAPKSNEPAVPPGVRTVIHVVSIRALGKPLTEDVAHRADEIARITQASIGEHLSTTHLARLIASDDGGLRNTHDARVIALINMVESREQQRLARLVVDQVLDTTDRIERCVIGAMADEQSDLIVVDR